MWFLKKNFFLILEREQERGRGTERERERERESQAVSMIRAEPDVGLNPTTLGS